MAAKSNKLENISRSNTTFMKMSTTTDSSATSPRQDLISSAVKFLSDPKVQSAPLAKRIAFLESKGMTSKEIELALQQVNGGSNASSTSSGAVTTMNAVDESAPSLPPKPNGVTSQQYQGYPAVPYGYPHPYPPQMQVVPHQPWTWKDYTIGLTAAGAVTYGLAKLIQNYVVPAFTNYPSPSSVESQTKQIESSLELSTKTLTSIDKTTTELVSTLQTQNEDLTKTLAALSAAIVKMEDEEEDRKKEVDVVLKEVEQLKVLLPKVMDRAKEHQGSVMTEIQSEIRSMKSLFLGRRQPQPSGTGSASSSSDEMNSNANKWVPPMPESEARSIPTSSLSNAKIDSSDNGRPGPRGPAAPSVSSTDVPTKKPAIPAWQLEAMNASAAKTANASSENAASVTSNLATEE